MQRALAIVLGLSLPLVQANEVKPLPPVKAPVASVVPVGNLAKEAAKPAAHAAPKAVAKPVVKRPAKEEPESHGTSAKHEEDPNHWSYDGKLTGPNQWGRMGPANAPCSDGKEQSPINVTGAVPQQLAPLKFSYGMSKLAIVNNGHTIQVNVEPGSWLEAFEDKFELKQFHFHTPSEEQINGKQYSLVAHLVHRSEEGKLAVIAVLFELGRENPVLEALWPRMPSEHGETRSFAERVLSPASLLPSNLKFYTLMGSLTTPPCSEGVRWIILKTPVELSAAQLARFKQEFPMNARPIQPLNGRMIFESM